MADWQYDHDGLMLTETGEGFRSTAYQDSGGVWTIGYGHTGPDVHPGLTITQEQGELLLASDIKTAADFVNRVVTSDITQKQFDALVDLCFNIGRTAFLNSTVLKKILARDLLGAEQAFMMWVNVAGKKNVGLVRRRNMEVAVFKA